MKRHRDQEGSTLLIVLGVVATLAIMATALVALTGNVMSNTMTNRVNITAFSACESAIDTTMLQLGNSWPDTSAHQYKAWSAQTPTSPTPSPIPSFVSAMTSQNVEWPSPRPTTLGPAINVWVYDNIDGGTTGWVSPYSATNPPPWDANGDALLYVVSQACVGERRSRVQVQVTRPQGGIDFPRGTDLWCGGNMTDTGTDYTDHNLKIGDVFTAAETPAGQVVYNKDATSGPTAVRSYIQGTITATGSTPANNYVNLTDFPPVVTTPSSTEGGVSTWKSLEQIFSTSLVQRCIAKAKADGTYYTSQPPPGNMSGFLVIDLSNGNPSYTVPAGTKITITNTTGTSVNTKEAPGVLLVLGGPPGTLTSNLTCTMTGASTYYGVVYTTGNFQSSAAGTDPHIRGAVFVQGNVTFLGKDHFYYHDDCIQNLGLAFSLTCKQVPGTWREVKPLP